MEYRLVADSCCELTEGLKRDTDVRSVPLSILIDDKNYIDDETLDMDGFMLAMKGSRHAAKSACPSPEQYAQAMRGAQGVFAVTISAKLSGSYSSAVAACRVLTEEGEPPRMHVFDSRSASAGQIAVCLKIQECISNGLDFETIVETVEAYIRNMKTFFILENLDTLIKNGRMSRITGYVASAMSLRPIMTADMGEIKLFEKARGSVRAFTRLIDIIGEKGCDFARRTLVITHCNNEKQARFIRAEAEKRYGFKQIIVERTRGLSSMYANEGGVIIAF